MAWAVTEGMRRQTGCPEKSTHIQRGKSSTYRWNHTRKESAFALQARAALVAEAEAECFATLSDLGCRSLQTSSSTSKDACGRYKGADSKSIPAHDEKSTLLQEVPGRLEPLVAGPWLARQSGKTSCYLIPRESKLVQQSCACGYNLLNALAVELRRESRIHAQDTDFNCEAAREIQAHSVLLSFSRATGYSGKE
eukprot:1147870-Pelagomonas_calceolata.AAC.2